MNFAAVPTETSVDFPVKGHYLFDEKDMVQNAVQNYPHYNKDFGLSIVWNWNKTTQIMRAYALLIL